jgi:predicted transposase YbfD/YdcC
VSFWCAIWQGERIKIQLYYGIGLDRDKCTAIRFLRISPLFPEERMAANSRVGSIKSYFRCLKDPRVRQRTRHRLIDIIVIALCGVIANCDGWSDIIDFATTRLAWFKRFLTLPNGIPSHDTFERVFANIDPAVFNRCCIAWLRDVSDLVGLGHLAIDGKTLRGSASPGLKALHLVSAWASEANLSLGEVAVEGKSNEIKAIPELLKLLDLKGALVTIDAIGCQKAIAQQIVDKGGNYLLAVKANQEHLLEDIQATVAKAVDGAVPKAQVATITTTGEGHGRKEQRTCMVITNLEGIRDRHAWTGLTTVGICVRERTVNGESTADAHYFIASGRLGARKAANALRSHWAIENNLHWHLDVHFGEDRSRLQERHAARNFASMRKLALCVLKRHPAEKSIPRKRKLAAQNPDFLAEILTGAANVEEV